MSERAETIRKRENAIISHIDLFQCLHGRKPSYLELSRLTHITHETQVRRYIQSMLRRNALQIIDGMYLIVGRRAFQPDLHLQASA